MMEKKPDQARSTDVEPNDTPKGDDATQPVSPHGVSPDVANATVPAGKSEPRAYLLFLRNYSTPSTLIELTLKNAGFHITLAHDMAHLKKEWESGVHELMIVDHSVTTAERNALLAGSTKRHRPYPVIMVFEPGEEREAAEARENGAVDCVVRDAHGEYLLLIPSLVQKFIDQASYNETHELPPSITRTNGEITDEIDLRALADELRSTYHKHQRGCLVVMAGPDVGCIAQLGNDGCMIGRDPTCQLKLQDDSISRIHASVKQHKNGVVTIKDLNSTNGTFLAGQRIDAATLSDNDTVLLGKNTVIKFQSRSSVQKSLHDELYEFATRDNLTGILNRRAVLERMSANMSFAKRHRCPVSLLMMDIDDLQRVNDTYGHLAGDTTLTRTAQHLLSNIRAEDVLGRYSGEVFLLLAPGIDAAGGKALAERIRAQIEQDIISMENDPRNIRITVSIGVATVTHGRSYDPDVLISTAEVSLFRAKDGGRNCVVATEVTRPDESGVT